MNRRALLRSGAVLASGALAGCSALLDGERDDAVATPNGERSSPGSGDSADRTREERPSTASDRGSGDADVLRPGSDRFRWDPAGDAVLRTTVGDPAEVPFPGNTRPVTVRFWNAGLSRRTFRIDLVRPDSGAARWRRTVTFGPEDYLVLEVVDPGDYDLVVHHEGQAVGVAEVERGDFDCNRTWLDARVRSDGTFQTTGGSTMMGCPGPEVVSAEVSGSGTDCGTEDDDARVSTAGQRVRVTGRVAVPDPCYAVDDVSATYEREADRLLVTVAVAEGGTDCRECPAVVSYEAGVELAHAYPGTAVVGHATPARTRERVRVAEIPGAEVDR